MISNRLEITTKDLIGKQQNGFIRGRSIMTNVASTRGIISYLNRKKLPGVIAVIDFEKCFDRIEHNSIKGVFKYFGFGDTFIGMVMMLFKDIELCTINNGYLSKFFVKGRGINQGCPASPLIYSFCGEILNHLVAQNANINGVPFPNLKNLLSQFADDTSVFLKYDQISINSFTNTLERVETEMGLKVSYDKTIMYRVGSIKDSNAKLYTCKNFTWSDGPVETLGVKLSANGDVDPENFEIVLQKLKDTCSMWYNRNMTLTGRVLVVNTLMGSLFIYKMLALGNMDAEQLKRVEPIDYRVYLVR